ncbi:MAG: hypothetical protein ACRCT8_11925 [Lacipirellulaceae bacterium]
MIDLPLTEASPDWRPLVDALRAGDSVRLVFDGKPIGVASPVEGAEAAPNQSFANFMKEWRSRHDVEEIGFTQDEVDSWRDRSPGRELPF